MYEIDELAGIVAMASEKEQLALTEDIRLNGQREDAVLWRGRIVDGRCRQLACIVLDVELGVKRLDDGLTRDEVAKVVKSLNVRRNLTMTQKVVSAIYEQKRTGEVNAKIASSWAIGLATLKNGKYVEKHRPEFLGVLFNGGTVKLLDSDKGFVVTTNKINTLARMIKKSKEVGVVTDRSEEIEFSVDGVLKTEKAKVWYYSTVDMLRITDPLVRILLVELANYKHQVSSV